jgi:GH24 family phage-related lysozyme (muramidase)
VNTYSDADQLKVLQAKLLIGSNTQFYGEKPVASRAFSMLKKVAITVTLAAIFSGSSMYFNQADWMPFSNSKVAASTGTVSHNKAAPTVKTITATPDASKLTFINDNTSSNIKDVVKLLVENNEQFLATAVIMESIQLKPYMPPEGRNNITVGIGYCIPERVKAFGVAAVKSDFTKAGISSEMQDKLMAKNATKNGSFVTQAQAIKLLAIVAPYYEDVARSWLGDSVFDSLNKNQRAALTWLAYNVGQDNLPGFHHLKKVVIEISKHQAPKVDNPFMSKSEKSKMTLLEAQFLHHITPTYVNGKGDSVVNERVEHVMKGVVHNDYKMAMN